MHTNLILGKKSSMLWTGIWRQCGPCVHLLGRPRRGLCETGGEERGGPRAGLHHVIPGDLGSSDSEELVVDFLEWEVV